jgi:hypothetical protein
MVLDVLVGLLWGTGAVLILANRPDFFDANAAFLIGLFGATVAAYAVAGTLIARQQPSNPIAWLFFEMAVFLVYGTTATEYAVHALRADPGSLPAPDVVLALAEPTPMLFIVGLILVLYVFPTGRTSGRRGGSRCGSWSSPGSRDPRSSCSLRTPSWTARLRLVRVVQPLDGYTPSNGDGLSHPSVTRARHATTLGSWANRATQNRSAEKAPPSQPGYWPPLNGAT